MLKFNLLYMGDIITTYGMKNYCRCYAYKKVKLKVGTRRGTVWATWLFAGSLLLVLENCHAVVYNDY